MKAIHRTLSVLLLAAIYAARLVAQEPLSRSANLAPFPEPARTDEWSFSLEPNQMATYNVGIALSGTSPDNKTYTFRSSSYAVLPPENINTLWVWTVSGGGRNYVCQVANTHWLEAQTTVTISCQWARVADEGTGTGTAGGGLDVIDGWARGIAEAIEADLAVGVNIEIEGAPDYLCIEGLLDLSSWLVLGAFPYDDWQPVDAIWTVEPVGEDGGDGIILDPTYASLITFIPTDPGEVRITATVPEGSGTLQASVQFIIYEVQSIIATPGNWPPDQAPPEPVWIGAGGFDSAAHQADVVITVAPPVAGIPIEVRLERGIGHVISARLDMNGQIAAGGMPGVEVLTGGNGFIEGTLTSSDSIDTCTIHACARQAAVEFNWVTQFDPETDWLIDPEYLPVPGVLTNVVRFLHHRGPASDAPSEPFDGHEIRFFVEEVQWIDTNGDVHVIENTPDNPSNEVDAWAVFEAPSRTSADGWVTNRLTVYDNPELYSITMVAYDWDVWNTPPPQPPPPPLGIVTLTQQQTPVKDRSNSPDLNPQQQYAVWTEFVQDGSTCYNFSPALGESAAIKVRKIPPEPVPGFGYRMEIVRLLRNGGHQVIDTLDVVPGGPVYDVARGTDFDTLLLAWNGMPGDPGFAGPPGNLPQAEGPEEFQGVNGTFYRMLPAVELNQPAPPPLYFARSVIFHSSMPNVEYHVAYHPIYVPQVVLLELTQEAETELLQAMYYDQDPNVLIAQAFTPAEVGALLDQLAVGASAYYGPNANIRFVTSLTGLSGKFSRIKLKNEDSTARKTLGRTDQTTDFGNILIDDTANVFVRGIRNTVLDRHYYSEQEDPISGDSYPPIGLPLTKDEQVFSHTRTTTHEQGHMLGLVMNNNVLGGNIGSHNSIFARRRIMNGFAELMDSLEAYINRDVDDNDRGPWIWRTLNKQYLEFILPRP